MNVNNSVRFFTPLIIGTRKQLLVEQQWQPNEKRKEAIEKRIKRRQDMSKNKKNN